jgi:Flp pilus assembly protein TadG
VNVNLPPRRRTLCSRRGASAAELAIIVPLLITLALGCVDFGRFAYSYIALTNAARAGASYAIMNNYGSSTAYNTWLTGVTNAAQHEMDNQIGYSSSNPVSVSAPVVSVDGTTGLRTVTLTVSYPFNSIISWVFGGYFVPRSMNMSRAIVVRPIR